MQELVKNLVAFDKKISKSIFDLQPKSEMLKEFIRIITIGFGVGPLFLLALIVSKNLILTILIFTFIVGLNFVLVENLIKKKVKRMRPDFMTNRLKTFSFPSSHSSTMAMLLIFIFLRSDLFNLTPFVIILMIVWAIFVVISRILYGYHYLFDVLFGIFTGAILGLLFFFAVEILKIF